MILLVIAICIAQLVVIRHTHASAYDTGYRHGADRVALDIRHRSMSTVTAAALVRLEHLLGPADRFTPRDAASTSEPWSDN